MVCIADTGFIVALNSPVKREREWARGHFEERGAPFYTCEAALTEASHLIEPAAVGRLVESGFLAVRFSLFEQIAPLVRLMEKYSGRMDVADACVPPINREVLPVHGENLAGGEKLAHSHDSLPAGRLIQVR